MRSATTKARQQQKKLFFFYLTMAMMTEGHTFLFTSESVNEGHPGMLFEI
jgi:hypothetical protein